MKVSEPKKKSLSQFLTTFLSFLLFAYFAYHLIHGDRGYFAWKGLEMKLAKASDKYDKTMTERLALENRVKLLRPKSLDIDMLDERARVVLGFVKPDEKVILTRN